VTDHVQSPHQAYLKSDGWKCQRSPSGAHHWVECRASSTDSGTFQCVHCGEKRVQENLVTWNRRNNRSGT